MSLLLTNLAREIDGYVDWTATTVGGVFNLIASTGAFLLQSFVFLMTHFWLGALNLVDGTAILLNDFILFIGDVYDLSDELLTLVNCSVSQLCEACSKSFFFFLQTITAGQLLLNSFIQGSHQLMWSLFLGTKSLLILVGDGTIFLIQLGPSIAVSLYIGLVSLIGWIFQNAWIILFRFVSGIVSTISGIHYELTDIPPSSLLGMLLALVIAIVVRCYLKTINWTALRRNIKSAVGDWLRRRRRSRNHITSGSASLNDSGSSVDETSVAGLLPSLKRAPLGAVNQQQRSTTKENLLRQLQLEREDKLCIVCQDQNKCVILLPCRHFCLCQICMQRVAETDPVCPICRQFVLDHLRIYGWWFGIISFLSSSFVILPSLFPRRGHQIVNSMQFRIYVWFFEMSWPNIALRNNRNNGERHFSSQH